MPQALPEVLQARLETIRAAQRIRRRQPFARAGQARATWPDGRQMQVFCSNDYLGLAGHPVVCDAWCGAVDAYGVGSTASQYINGHSAEIAGLESELAEFLGYPRVLVAGSGYLINVGVIDALLGRGDDILSDALNHASLIDGCRLSGARLHPYAHADFAALQAEAGRCGDGHRLLVSDAVFSMDGDSANLPRLADSAQSLGAWLMVDDAHGVGVCGPGGRGSVAAAGLGVAQVPIMTGTLGKAFGVYGAFVAGDVVLIEYLSQVLRTAIFATALPPALIASVRASLGLVRQADARRSHLQALIRRFRDGLVAYGLPDTGSATPIQPIILGSEARALTLAAALQEDGFWVTAIRPPTVPAGQCRLRITLSAAHQAETVDELIAAIARHWPDVGGVAA